MKYFIFFVASLLFLSCETYSPKDLENFDKEIQHYLDSVNVSMEKTEDGMYYTIIDEGEGEDYVSYKDEVTFYYTGYLLNGNSFQSIQEDDPITHPVQNLIVGWQDALMMLKKGGRMEIIIPPQLGYGDRTTELIPKNSILRYRIGVVDIH